MSEQSRIGLGPVRNVAAASNAAGSTSSPAGIMATAFKARPAVHTQPAGTLASCKATAALPPGTTQLPTISARSDLPVVKHARRGSTTVALDVLDSVGITSLVADRSPAQSWPLPELPELLSAVKLQHIELGFILC